MIFLKRKRLLFWLLKAYAKRLRKTIFLSFIIGLLGFFLLRYGVNYFVPLLPFTNQEKIGIEGAYTIDNMPSTIISRVSSGLTKIDKNYNVIPGVAKKWEIKDNGKTYIFYLKDNVYFTDKQKLTSDLIKYNFIDVITQIPNKNTIIFRLKNNYSPFLMTVSRPILKKGFVGIGDYKVQSISLNGDFVQSISLRSIKEQNKILNYQFYPTEEALKTAFVLGEVNIAIGLTDTKFKDTTLEKFKKVSLVKSLDDRNLVTLFYNTQDKDLSDKRLREAMSYAVPDNFSQGLRNYGPFSPNSWVVKNGLTTYIQDFEHSKLLLNESDLFKAKKNLTVELKTFPKYLDIAKIIQENWLKVGIKVKIVTTETFPSSFQIFLGDYMVPKDPDQYSLWHSDQIDNVTKYKNLRIDKLLEDGRQIIDISERRKIYADFQKYLLDDSPATFLLFPYRYDVTRR